MPERISCVCVLCEFSGSATNESAVHDDDLARNFRDLTRELNQRNTVFYLGCAASSCDAGAPTGSACSLCDSPPAAAAGGAAAAADQRRVVARAAPPRPLLLRRVRPQRARERRLGRLERRHRRRRRQSPLQRKSASPPPPPTHRSARARGRWATPRRTAGERGGEMTRDSTERRSCGAGRRGAGSDRGLPNASPSDVLARRMDGALGVEPPAAEAARARWQRAPHRARRAPPSSAAPRSKRPKSSRPPSSSSALAASSRRRPNTIHTVRGRPRPPSKTWERASAAIRAPR